MKRPNTFKLLITMVALLVISHAAFSQLSLDVEANIIAGVPYNKVRIPAAGGTQFDLAKDLAIQNRFTYRMRANYTINDRHVISALYAPLTVRSKGRLKEMVVYSGETYNAEENVSAKYKFNSYRLTYRYLIVANDRTKFGLGLTAKVRDANISLSQGGTSSDFPDLGVVPLINFYLNTMMGDKLHLLFEGDALVSKQGRAEDIFLGLSYPVNERVAAKAGIRTLEGGADVEKNYNFTWINYAAVGVVVTFEQRDEGGNGT